MPEITEDFFWQIVEEIQWDTVGRTLSIKGLQKLQYQLMDRFTPEECEALWHIHNDKAYAVRELLETYAEEHPDFYWGLSDDGLTDLVAHIVGLGKEEYEKNLADPLLGVQRALDGKFVENFEYVWPSPDDFQARAERESSHYLADLAESIRTPHLPVLEDYRYSEEYKDEYRQLFACLQLVIEGQWTEALAREEEVLRVAKKIGASYWSFVSLFTEVKERVAQSME